MEGQVTSDAPVTSHSPGKRPPHATASSHVLLLRHGQSEWNSAGRWQGRADIRLSALGRRQAADVGRALLAHREIPTPIASVWTSTLARAHETACIVAGVLGVEPVRPDQRLVETDAGPWQGLTRGEIHVGWPGYLDDHRRPDGFEPLHLVVERAIGVLVDIAHQATVDGLPMAITHAGLIRTLIREIGPADVPVPNLTGWLFAVAGSDVTPLRAFDPGAATVDRRSTTPTLG